MTMDFEPLVGDWYKCPRLSGKQEFSFANVLSLSKLNYDKLKEVMNTTNFPESYTITKITKRGKSERLLRWKADDIIDYFDKYWKDTLGNE